MGTFVENVNWYIVLLKFSQKQLSSCEGGKKLYYEPVTTVF